VILSRQFLPCLWKILTASFAYGTWKKKTRSTLHYIAHTTVSFSKSPQRALDVAGLLKVTNVVDPRDSFSFSIIGSNGCSMFRGCGVQGFGGQASRDTCNVGCGQDKSGLQFVSVWRARDDVFFLGYEFKLNA